MAIPPRLAADSIRSQPTPCPARGPSEAAIGGGFPGYRLDLGSSSSRLLATWRTRRIGRSKPTDQDGWNPRKIGSVATREVESKLARFLDARIRLKPWRQGSQLVVSPRSARRQGKVETSKPRIMDTSLLDMAWYQRDCWSSPPSERETKEPQAALHLGNVAMESH